MIKIVNILILGLIIPQMGCKKEPKPKPEFVKLRIGEAKDYIWAKTGSYWIYKNTKTNELDTWTCVGFSYDSFVVKGSMDYSKHITLDFDRVSVYIKNTYNKFNFVDRTGNKYPDFSNFRNNRYVIDRNCESGLIVPFFYPFGEGFSSGTGSSYTVNIGVDTFLNLQSKEYRFVSKFKIDSDDIWYPDDYLGAIKYPNAIYYWAKDVGLIKRENLTENFSWELIKYNIIK